MGQKNKTCWSFVQNNVALSLSADGHSKLWRCETQQLAEAAERSMHDLNAYQPPPSCM